MSNLDYALKYASVGWPVLPVIPREKKPLDGNGFDHATTDEQIIRGWFNHCPDANIGIALAPAGLAAIDIDPRHGGCADDLPGALDTLTAKTGDGLHLLVRVPAGAELPGKLQAGIDIKWRGYIVVEPSVHPSGAPYSWLDWDVLTEPAPPIADAPHWLLEPSRPTHASPSSERRTDDWLAELLRGESVHESAVRIVGKMVSRGLDDPMIRAWFQGVAQTVASERGAERAHELVGAELERMIRGARRKGFAPPTPEPEGEPGSEAALWRNEPANLFRDIAAPAFAPEDTPRSIRALAETFSAVTGFDLSGAIVAATVAAAAAIDDRYRLTVRPASDWFESARLWAVLIGTPSAGKSPTIRAATDPIKDMHTELFAKWLAENADAKDADQAPKPALFTSDATTEALADRLRDNPRGLLMLTEEFASWIGGIDAYRDGAGARNRGEWLQLYDGGPHQVDRVKRGSFLVPNWGASVLAACTPAGLRDQVKKLPDDGLIHRFMPCLMGAPKAPGRASAREALRDWSIRLREVFASTTCEKAGAKVRISTGAQIVFDGETRAIRESVDSVYDLSPALASHLGKHPGMLARVALVFHVIDGRQGDAIERDTMEQAARFMHTVRRHAAALFLGILSTAPALEVARGVARAIVGDAARPVSIGRNYMTQRCRAFRQAPDLERRLAVQSLEDAYWLAPVPDSRAYGGWGASEWGINPAVFERFAAEGEAHRDRRQAVRELMGAG